MIHQLRTNPPRRGKPLLCVPLLVLPPRRYRKPRQLRVGNGSLQGQESLPWLWKTMMRTSRRSCSMNQGIRAKARLLRLRRPMGDPHRGERVRGRQLLRLTDTRLDQNLWSLRSWMMMIRLWRSLRLPQRKANHMMLTYPTLWKMERSSIPLENLQGRGRNEIWCVSYPRLNPRFGMLDNLCCSVQSQERGTF
jgi:hypothetical protein